MSIEEPLRNRGFHIVLSMVKMNKPGENTCLNSAGEGSHKSLSRVMVTLRYLAKGDFLSEVADVHGISKSSASRCINSVCDAMCHRLNNIHFPRNNAEVREVKEKFYSLASFPNVIGAIDGTLIPIQGMTGTDENLYVCRKGFHALNIMAVADAKMR
ncbi:putative nuclease HARBI1 [Gigantopelta aegis]|uniref:putative nuclease HARBI1 n=1 Tax=Gigantopelta aegis TaxID=1735272 RepID=UPI001B88AC64|nr:putative nuclease HARBI1 [Gigantopelta aegis]